MEKKEIIATFDFKKYFVSICIEGDAVTARLNGDGEDLFDKYMFYPGDGDDDSDLDPEEKFELTRIICRELEERGIDRRERVALPDIEWGSTSEIKTTLFQKFVAKNMLREKDPDSLRKLGIMFRAEGDIQKEEYFRRMIGTLIPSAYLPATCYIYMPVLRSIGTDEDGNLALRFRTNGFGAGTTIGSHYVGYSMKELIDYLTEKVRVTAYANPYIQILILKEGRGIENFYLDHGGTFGHGMRGWSFLTTIFYARQLGATPVYPLYKED